MPRPNTGTRQKVEAAERQAQAMQLKLAGATYEEIATALGYSSKQAAWRSVQRAREDMLRDPAEELVKQEADRLDRLQRALWTDAIKGNQGAVDRVLRVMERRAKLLGLDAPLKQEVTGANGEPTRIVIEYA